MSSTDIYIAIVGGGQSVFTAGQGISMVSATGQAIAGTISAVGPIGGALAVNPAAGLITLVKIGVDASSAQQVNVGDALSIVGNSVSVAAAICAVVPGGQPLALSLAVIGRAMALAGIGLSLLDVNYPLSSNVAMSSNVNTLTTAALNWVPQRDPLVLDLDGNGINTSAINTSAPILFDQEGTGVKTATGWIASGEAIVVRDLNGNGKIDSGRELFGDSTVLSRGQRAGQIASNGFEALADLDSNTDGKFDNTDAAYASVKLWKDANQNGISEASELFTFEQLGVKSVNLSATASNVNLVNGNGQATGNTQTFAGTFTRTNGIAGTAGTAELAASLLLTNNKFYRQFTDDPAITTAAKALPQMQGSGAVRDLRPALSLGNGQAAALQNSLRQYSRDSTRDQQLSHLDALVQNWGKTSSMPTSLQTSTVQANSATGVGFATAVAEFARNKPTLYAQITALEQFNGQTILDKWVVTTGKTSSVTFSSQQEAFIGQAYAALAQSVYAALVTQTRLRPYLESIGLVIDNNGTSFNTAPLVEKLNAFKKVDERGALLDLAELNRYAGDKLQAVNLNGFVLFGSWMDALPLDSPLRAEVAAAATTVAVTVELGLSSDDIYVGDNAVSSFSAGAGNDRVYGGAGADILSGDAGNDTLLGGLDNDLLYGGAGDDILIGGKGNDTLNGGTGNDTYVFNKGDGADTIIDYDYTPGNSDTLSLGAGLNISTAAMSRSDSDLLLGWGTDSVKLKNYFGDASSRIETLVSGDGTRWSYNDIANTLVYAGTAGAESLTGISDQTNRINGLAGNDTLIGGNLADRLDGGEGDDTIYGGGGNDILIGGKGNDTLNGGQGNDTYVFNKGDGADTISDYDYTQGNSDTLSLGAGLNISTAAMSRSDSDLLLGWGVDSVKLQNYFGDASSRIETLVSGDGTRWGYGDIANTLIYAGTAGAESLTGISDQTNRINGLAGNDTLTGGNLADRLDGGEGNDTLYGSGGNDTLIGGLGNDFLNGGQGNDTYVFNKGDGADTINDYDYTPGNSDTLSLGAGLNISTAAMARVDSDLLLGWGTDSVKLQNYFGDASSRIETLVSGDGTRWGYIDAANTLVYAGTGGAETLAGLADQTNRINGLAGNDTLTGGNLADRLDGGEGNDTLYGGGGNDTLIGGLGNDLLNGGTGNDAYVFNKGDGADTINDYDYTPGNSDTLSLSAGLNISTAAMSRVDGDLVLGWGTDSVKLQNYFGDSASRIETLVSGDGTRWGYNEVANVLVYAGTANADTLTGIADQTNRINGLAGNDMLTGGNLADRLDGGEGNDTLYGGGGNDTLIGGLGNDTLNGGTGNDTYGFNKGDGADTINDYDYTSGNSDMLSLGAGLNISTAAMSRSDSDLVLGWGTDSVKLQNYFGDASSRIETLVSGDGSRWSYSDIAKTLVYAGTAGAESLTGLADQTNRINGLAGNDTLTGGNLADRLDGGEGDDTLYGGAGNDILIGGKGNDFLNGGQGNDTYVLNKGDGADTISDYDYTSGNSDTLSISNVASNQLWFAKSGNDLLVSVIGTTDSMKVQNWYSGDSSHVEKIQTGDGKLLLDSQVQNLVQAMAGFAPPAAGQTTLPTSYQASLNSVIAANWH